MASALINVPAKAKRGDVIEIKTLMSHIMDTGFPDEEFDVVVSTFSLLTYASWDMFETRSVLIFQAGLKELLRTTKVGGVILLAPIKVSKFPLAMLLGDANVEIISSPGGETRSLVLKRLK